jgi:2'-5' RNA ligase
LRLFAALELPAPVVAELVAWGARAAGEGLRPLPASSLHVTLAFLGSRPDEEVEDIAGAVVACAAPVPGLCVARAAWLGRGSALAVDLADGEGACGALQTAVASALKALGVFAPDERPFRPHVTIARVRRGARVARHGLPEPPALGPFAGTALTLFASQLSAAGASYRALARADLPR